MPDSVFYLDARLMARAREASPFWHRACKLVGGGLTGESLGGIHFREGEFAQFTKTEAGGVFGTDFGYMNEHGEFVGEGTMDDCLRAIRTGTAAICNEYGIDDNDINEDFFTACVVAAHELKSKIRLGRDHPGMLYLKDAMWGYNGRAAWHTPSGTSDRAKSSADFSSYVSNDPKRGKSLYLVPPGKTVSQDAADGSVIKIVGPKFDSRPGAFVICQELLTRSQELA